MRVKVWLMFMTLAMLAKTFAMFNQTRNGHAHLGNGTDDGSLCHGPYCGSNIEDIKTETILMESEMNRGHSLAGEKRYISYGALHAIIVPCYRKGNSYYNCGMNAPTQPNPYSRGCTALTRCRRYRT